MIRVEEASHLLTYVFDGDRKIGYCVKMLPFDGLIFDPRAGRKVGWMVAPERGGLLRSDMLRKSTAESLEQAIQFLVEMDAEPTSSAPSSQPSDP